MYHLYARVSTAEQAKENCVSLGDQLKKGHALGVMKFVPSGQILEYRDEGVSGSVPLAERPQGKRLVSRLRRYDTIVAAKLDRLFRSSRDALVMMEQWREKFVDVILLDMGIEPVQATSTGKLFFSMLAAFADFERERISERMWEAKVAKAAKGGCIGPPPYGYRKVGMRRDSILEKDEGEQEIVNLVRKYGVDPARRRHGSLARILRKINAQGVLKRNGTPYDYQTLLRIRKREVLLRRERIREERYGRPSNGNQVFQSGGGVHTGQVEAD